jgi:uncharacterized damage-inducible protein DinB
MEQLIREYADGYQLLRQAIEGLSAEQMRFRPAPGKWSIHEILVHMTDAEIVGIHRMKKVLAEEQPVLNAFDQDAWAIRLNYEELDAEQHLQLFRLLRESFLPVLRRVSEEEWERTGLHSEAGPLTLRQLLERYVHHVRDHLRQIERVREACRVQ